MARPSVMEFLAELPRIVSGEILETWISPSLFGKLRSCRRFSNMSNFIRFTFSSLITWSPAISGPGPRQFAASRRIGPRHGAGPSWGGAWLGGNPLVPNLRGASCRSLQFCPSADLGVGKPRKTANSPPQATAWIWVGTWNGWQSP